MIPLRLSVLIPVAALWGGLATGTAVAASAPVPPLLADDGSAYPTAQRMGAAETTAGGPAPGWATSAQMQLLQRLHPGRVVRLDATAGQPMAPASPATGAWVFVDGPGEGAVRLARALAAAGAEHVWVLLPKRSAAQGPAAVAASGSPR